MPDERHETRHENEILQTVKNQRSQLSKQLLAPAVNNSESVSVRLIQPEQERYDRNISFKN